MWHLAAMAVMSIGGDLMARNQEAAAVNGQIRATTLQNSAKSKAEGTETILNSKRSVERQTQTRRKALQLKGAAQASADSSNIGGISVQARVQDIQLQADEAIAVARNDAETKRRINQLSNKNAYKANLHTAQNYKPASLGSILIKAGMGMAAGYAMETFGVGGSEDG